MTKRRHALNPDKLKADIAALDEDTPPQVFRTRLDIRRRWSVLLMSLLSSVLLLVSFAPYDCWYLAYVALVPFGLAVAVGHRTGWALLWAYLAGVVFWAIGLYWITWITLLGYLLLIIYLGAYWLVAGAVLRAAFRRGWPMWATLPTIWVALEYARAFVLSGFPWFYLAHSQYDRTRLIQIADLTGQYGVSFFVAMVNGALVDALIQPLFVRNRRGGRLTRLIATAVGATAATAAVLLFYGSYRINQQTTRPGPRIGVQQLAFPISLVHEGAPSEKIFRQHLHEAEQFKGAGLDLAVWPESMLGLRDMNPSYWLGLDPDATRALGSTPLYTLAEQEIIRTYHRSLHLLQGLILDLKCPLLAGAGMPSLRDDNLRCNSALLFDLDEKGQLRLRNRYDKMHLVPFSEYVPFRKGWPGLHRLLRRFVPEVMPQLDPGTNRVRFELAKREGDGYWRFAVPICYEGVFARVCRQLAVQDGRKRIDLLINLSNDGWFIYQGRKYVFAGEQITHASTELDQHLAQYRFRAVESRVPVVRAVNTGISAHIDSNGRLVGSVWRGRRRKMVGGNLVAQTVVDDRVSVYSRIGDAFALAICVITAAGVVGLALTRPRARDDKDLKA